MKINIPFVNFKKQWLSEKNEITKIVEKIYERGIFVNGPEVDIFEKKIISNFMYKDCVALNSGTDALTLGLMSVGVRKGDEVITPPNSFVASTGSIIHIGAKPIFADVLQNQLIDPKKIEEKITKKTKAIMTVHLSGAMSNIEQLKIISKKYNIPLIEDAAQSIGSSFKSVMSGSWGNVGCFSAHPLKNLNASGDAGFIVTKQKKNLQNLRLMRNHGLENRDKLKYFGYVSRMDVLQAAILNFRLEKINQVISRRRSNAKLYKSLLNDCDIFIPEEIEGEFHTYHNYIIQTRKRDKLRNYLSENGIETLIHYKIPIHLQNGARFLGYKKGMFPVAEKQAKEILSLPIHQFLTRQDIEYVSSKIKKFLKNN
tara:strand:- start:765 stop:1874 length:1110 start_codon:yes stop_codon:yes gene_type:complete